jgi:pyruvate dehydrogenase E1 component alpha subunit
LDEWRKRDPISRFAAVLRERGLLDDAREQELTDRITSELDAAVTTADQYPYPQPATLTEGVYAQ